ncbi:MAG: hypothetical protein VW405_17855 [Rhodospirillaceae bacterium]
MKNGSSNSDGTPRRALTVFWVKMLTTAGAVVLTSGANDSLTSAWLVGTRVSAVADPASDAAVSMAGRKLQNRRVMDIGSLRQSAVTVASRQSKRQPSGCLFDIGVCGNRERVDQASTSAPAASSSAS